MHVGRERLPGPDNCVKQVWHVYFCSCVLNRKGNFLVWADAGAGTHRTHDGRVSLRYSLQPCQWRISLAVASCLLGSVQLTRRSDALARNSG